VGDGQRARGPQHRYRDTSTGRYISAQSVRRDVARMADTAGRDVARQLTTALKDGRIGLAEWQVGMARAVKNVNYAAVASGVGWRQQYDGSRARPGRGTLSSSSMPIYATSQSRLRSGEQPARRPRHASALKCIWTRPKGQFPEQKRAGFAGRHAGAVVMVRSHRHKRDSCRSCIDLHGKWFRMGDPEYMPVGHRECNVHCGCTEELGTLAADGTIAGDGLEGF
jgi:hypothetical protein